MPDDIDLLAPKRPIQPISFDPDRKFRKQHPAYRHFIDDRVEPFDEEQLKIGRGTADAHLESRRNPRGRHRHRQSTGCLLESLIRRPAPPANADIGVVREMLPTRGRRRLR